MNYIYTSARRDCALATESLQSLRPGTVRYGISFDAIPTRNDVAPYRPTLKSNSSVTTTSVMYKLGKTFEIISKFSVFLIEIGSVTAYLSAKNRTRRLFFKFECFREIRGEGIATVRPHLVANREMTTDRQNSSSQSREARLNTKAFVT